MRVLGVVLVCSRKIEGYSLIDRSVVLFCVLCGWFVRELAGLKRMEAVDGLDGSTGLRYIFDCGIVRQVK